MAHHGHSEDEQTSQVTRPVGGWTPSRGFWFGMATVALFSMVLIAAGALSPAMGGTLLRAGFADLLYLSEFIGAVLMFIGFVMATAGKAETVPNLTSQQA